METKVCKSCLGKKQFTVYRGDQVLQPDFIGDGRYLLKWEWIVLVDCSRCKWTGLEPEYIPEPIQEMEPQQDLVDVFHYWIDMAMKWEESRSVVVDIEPQQDDIVEKIMKAIVFDNNNVWWAWWVEIPSNILKSILNKYLPSK